MINYLEFLSKELIILTLNNLSVPDVKGRHNHPARRDILNLYLTCKNFKWLEDITISSVENFKVDRSYSTFDIFGNNVGIKLTHHYRANDYPPNEYLIDMITGFEYTDLQGNCNNIYLWCYDDFAFDGMHYDINYKEDSGFNQDTIIQTLTEILSQIKTKDPVFYKWCKQFADNNINELLIRYKMDTVYNMDLMRVFN
jgi:hypothetical protein